MLKANNVARLIDIRAPRNDGSNVVCLIQWIYRPELVPGGRKPYHGQTEVMPSTWLDIVEPHSIEGRVALYHCRDDREDDEEEKQGGQEDRDGRAVFETNQEGQVDILYWRQVIHTETNTLSQAKRHCRCNQPSNYEELMIKCDSCNKWLHAKCIEDDAVATRMKDIPNKKIKYTAKVERKSSGKCAIKCTSNEKKGSGGATEENVKCLICGTTIL